MHVTESIRLFYGTFFLLLSLFFIWFVWKVGRPAASASDEKTNTGRSEPSPRNWDCTMISFVPHIGADAFNRAKREGLSQLTAPYLDFIQQTLKDYPRLRATRIFQMIRARGYEGSVSQLRRIVAGLRPSAREVFLQLRTFPGEQGQADWAHFGQVLIGLARRRLSCFVIALSYSRDFSLSFFFDQGLENMLLRIRQLSRVSPCMRPHRTFI